MKKGFIEIPTNKKTFTSIGLILVVFVGLVLSNDSVSKEVFILMAITILGYLFSAINAPITKARTISPKLGEKYKKFVRNQYGPIRETEKDSKVIESNINLNMGFLVYLFYAVYLLIEVPVMEFLLLFSLTTAIYIYLSGIEASIGVIAPIYPLFFVLPASIYLKASPSVLFYTSTMLALSVSAIFKLRKIKTKRLVTVNIGGRGMFETIIVVSLLTVFLMIY